MTKAWSHGEVPRKHVQQKVCIVGVTALSLNICCASTAHAGDCSSDHLLSNGILFFPQHLPQLILVLGLPLSDPLSKNIPEMINQIQVERVRHPAGNWNLIFSWKLLSDMCSVQPTVILLKQANFKVTNDEGEDMWIPHFMGFTICCKHSFDEDKGFAVLSCEPATHHDAGFYPVGKFKDAWPRVLLTHRSPHTFAAVYSREAEAWFITMDDVYPLSEGPLSVLLSQGSQSWWIMSFRIVSQKGLHTIKPSSCS